MDKIAKNMAFGRTPLQEYVASGVGVGSSLKRGDVSYADVGGTFAGVNVNKRGRVFPRLAKDHYDNIYHSFMGQADNRVLERMLSRVVKPGSAQWKEYFDKRAGRVTQDSDGRVRYQVIANVEPVMANLSRRKLAQSTERVKKYQLNQVFSDALVRDKYSIHHSLLRDCQLLSVNDPASAAATLQEWMQRRAAPGVQVKVTADHNIMSNASAVRSISAMASLLPPVIGVESEVTGEQLFMRHPGGRWKVVGPLRYANIVRDVYRLCEKSGPQEAIHLYGHETGILRIDAYLDNKCLSPVIEAHVGHPSTLPADDSADTLSAITADMRASLESRRANVGLVTFEGGKVDGFVASSVRVERRLALVNAHVKTQGSSVRVQGKLPKYEMAVGSDVWAISDRGPYRQWVLRDAQVGEKVAVMFHNGKKVCVSDPFTVAAVDGALLYSRGKANVVPGMSGGALVGLKDMALLGIHSGEMVHCLVATAVTEQVYIDVVDYLTRSARTEDDASDVFAMVKARGLESELRSLLPSVEALCDDGKHIGTAAVVSPGIVASTADRRQYANAVPLDFPPISTSLWLGRGNNFKAVSNVREARLCEEVFCLGKDKSGFFTSRMTKVKYVAPEGKLFLLECVGDQKFPLVGSLVVALQDMAVLGFLCSAGFTPGDSVAYCVPFPGRGEVSVSRAFDLKRALPSLNPVVWDSEVLDAVFDLGKGSSALISKGRAVGSVSEQSAVKFWMGSALHTWGFPLNAPPERGRVLASVEALVGAVVEYEGEDMAKSLVSVITEGVDRGQ